VDVAASAIVLMPDCSSPVRYMVEDLSVGGALLRGGRPLRTGNVIRLALYLNGNAPLVVDADVVRQEPLGASGSGAAVVFRDLTAAQEDAIQDAILFALETLNGPDSGVRRRVRDDGSVDPVALPKRRARR
jgi:hypothetical protein